MESLEQRQKQREYLKGVESGEIKDTRASLGTDGDGNPLGDNLQPVKPEGQGDDDNGFGSSEANSPFNSGTGNGGVGNDQPADYSKIRTHADADAALAGRSFPEGWADMTVAAKVTWLQGNPPPPSSAKGGSENDQDNGGQSQTTQPGQNGQNGQNGTQPLPGSGWNN